MRATKRVLLRRAGSGAAVFVWLLGLYALPLAHNLEHRADHTHGAPEARPHAHGGGPAHVHEHPHPPGASHGEPTREAPPVPIDSDHGQGSVLHFASAALSGGTAAVDGAIPLVARIPSVTPCGATVAAARLPLARGPPPRG